MAILLSSLAQRGSGGQTDFHALRRDADGMLIYTKVTPKDADSIDLVTKLFPKNASNSKIQNIHR